MSDETPTLGEVTRQYQEAERRLTAIAEAAGKLTTVTGEVADMRSSVTGAAESLAASAAALAETTGAVSKATEALNLIDPAVIARRLEGIDSATTHLGRELSGAITQLNAVREQVQSVGVQTRRLQLLVIGATIVLVVLGVMGLG